MPPQKSQQQSQQQSQQLVQTAAPVAWFQRWYYWFLLPLLVPLSWLWRGVTWWRRQVYVAQPRSVPLVCIGNLTLGGQGKTPCAIAVQKLLSGNAPEARKVRETREENKARTGSAGQGERLFFLSRGYGGNNRVPLLVEPDRHRADLVGDEPLLLAAVAPTIIARDRAAGATLAESLGASMIIMDDGLQNPRLAPDCTLLVIDGTTGFGNRRVMPLGPLREPLEAGLARLAQRHCAAVLIGEDRSGTTALLERLAPQMPIFLAQLVASPEAISSIKGKRLVAFAAIGRPQKFFDSLSHYAATTGATVVAQFGFPDHHFYSHSEITALRQSAHDHQAELVTTSKDLVRLPPDSRSDVIEFPVELVFNSPQKLLAFLAYATRRRMPTCVGGWGFTP